MSIQRCLSDLSIFLLHLLPLLQLLPLTAFGYGSLGPIAASFGENGFFCAIDASGNQVLVCWDKYNKSTTSSPSSSTYFSSFPSMASLSGGEGFMCGITSNASKAYCWNLANPGTDLVPQIFQQTSYSQIAAGKDHVCAIRGEYYSKMDLGNVDCWQYSQPMENKSYNNVDIVYNSLFQDPSIGGIAFKMIVSGEGFSCGIVKDGSVICWGPKSAHLSMPTFYRNFNFKTLASGRQSVCGIARVTKEVECWGNNADEFDSTITRASFVSLSSGAQHYCGIREDDHSIECWGSIDVSSVPKGSGFTAIASSDYTTCGVREADLVLDCWGFHGQSPPDYSPPLQLCSPGVCLPESCHAGKFTFNASVLNEAGLTSLCGRKDLKLCLPCGINCSKGYFLSSPCTESADRVCTACSLCQNSSCWQACGIQKQDREKTVKKLIIIIGSSVSGTLIILIALCLTPRLIKTNGEKKVDADPELSLEPAVSINNCIGATQVFRLSELKDATNGFKEYNEVGRGSFGFVYKAVLSDGIQVAIKRANAATIIHTNTRAFEAELEILCNARHNNIVNLLGYCAEMGERLLVYEFMPRGTLYDHLHGELSSLDWSLRLKISLQAARGLEYIHKEIEPLIAHRDVKTSNIFLDTDWVARVADFGLLSASERDLNEDIKSDVYNFGIVLLEILSGRKAYDIECTPPEIVEWATQLIRNGKAAAIVDRNLTLPRNVEPLLKLADIAELCLRENPIERPSMSEIVSLLDQTVKNGFTVQSH